MDAGYLIGKFLQYYPAYKIYEILDMDYELYNHMLDMTGVFEAEEVIRGLNIVENQLLLKSKNTCDKYRDIYSRLGTTIKKGIEIKEAPHFDSKGLANLKARLTRGKGGGKDSR